MPISWKNPIVVSITSFIISFVGFIVTLRSTKPYYVLSKSRVNFYKIIIYSLLFANVVAIIALLLFLPRTSKVNKSSYVPESRFNYCGGGPSEKQFII